jgi:N-acetylmuramoyl-L-alanine amidase
MNKFLFFLLVYAIFSPFTYAQKNNGSNGNKIQINATESVIKETQIVIKKKYINYDAKRRALSLEYMKTRHGLTRTTPVIEPKMIVLHYTGGGTLQSNYDYFNRTEIEAGREKNRKQSKLNVSAQFLVDRDGTIYQIMDDSLFARHAIGLNYCAIGVENIGGDKNPLTKEQVAANIKLVRHLCKKYKIEYLIGHSEYTRFRNSPMWKETDPGYITYKADPGEDFMKKVRAQLTDLKLKDKP